VNAISVSHRRIGEYRAVAIYDVDECIRARGCRATLSGALAGFVFGALFVANPISAEVLTFGIVGTLIVCTIESAVVAGGFWVVAAVLYGQGVLRANTTGLERMLVAGRLPVDEKAASPSPFGVSQTVTTSSFMATRPDRVATR
jgi:hypothetical protein